MLISDYFEYYRLAAYLTRYTAEPIAVTMGVANLLDLFNEKYYTELEGGILEAFGKLFTKDLRLYVYPLRDESPAQSRRSRMPEIPAGQHNLFRHMVEQGRIKQLDNSTKASSTFLSGRPETNQRERLRLGAHGAVRSSGNGQTTPAVWIPRT